MEEGTIFDKAINISIFNDKAILSYYNNKVLKHKTIKLENLLEVFVNTNITHKTSYLPGNIIRQFKTGDLEGFILFYPPETKNIKHIQFSTVIVYPDCKIPSRIWKVVYKNDVRYCTESFFVKETNRFEINDKTILYRNIFPNVYANGKICWGYYNGESFSKPLTADAVDFSFFNSEFNNDLASLDSYSPEQITSVAGFIQFLSNSQEYSNKLFIDSGYCLGDKIR